ncbi:class I SAM-dependent methyltransferase [Streptomyces sp. NPDC001205]
MPYGTPAHDPTTPRSARYIFGDDAEQYDAARPGYPPQLIEDVGDFASAATDGAALEVGAGTGKATLPFAHSGLAVTCVEPDARMARVLRRRCAHLPRVTVEVADFETWHPTRRYDLLYCAQAWHWVDPAVRWARARAALEPGGAVALFWNHWALPCDHLAGLLRAAHTRLGIEVPADTLLDPRPRPVHRGSEARQWRDMTANRFRDPDHRLYTSLHEPSTSDLLGLFASYGGYRALPAHPRQQIFDELGRIIDEEGGRTQLNVTTSLFLGRAGHQ